MLLQFTVQIMLFTDISLTRTGVKLYLADKTIIYAAAGATKPEKILCDSKGS